MLSQKYKKSLDDKIDSILKETDYEMPKRILTIGEKISNVICTFLGEWSWVICLTFITFGWIIINAVPALTFDPYPYGLYTMIISVWALYSTTFLQMSSNLIMEQLIWTLGQISTNSKKHEISLLLLHEKMDLNNELLYHISNKLTK
jgi:uncharacterized membrane protein